MRQSSLSYRPHGMTEGMKYSRSHQILLPIPVLTEKLFAHFILYQLFIHFVWFSLHSHKFLSYLLYSPPSSTPLFCCCINRSVVFRASSFQMLLSQHWCYCLLSLLRSKNYCGRSLLLDLLSCELWHGWLCCCMKPL